MSTIKSSIPMLSKKNALNIINNCRSSPKMSAAIVLNTIKYAIYNPVTVPRIGTKLKL